MAWTFVRPRDASLLTPRPLLDVGTGDAQTVLELADATAVGIDRSLETLRAAKQSGLGRVVCGDTLSLPFRPGSFAVVLAADLLHHIPDSSLTNVLREARAVLRPDGRLVAWWYEQSPHPAPDAPRFPRGVDEVLRALRDAGFDSGEELELDATVGGGPPTVGIVAP